MIMMIKNDNNDGIQHGFQVTLGVKSHTREPFRGSTLMWKNLVTIRLFVCFSGKTTSTRYKLLWSYLSASIPLQRKGRIHCHLT